jgi:hypothetical protein
MEGKTMSKRKNKGHLVVTLKTQKEEKTHILSGYYLVYL